jgi:hypothetical protein
MGNRMNREIRQIRQIRETDFGSFSFAYFAWFAVKVFTAQTGGEWSRVGTARSDVPRPRESGAVRE